VTPEDLRRHILKLPVTAPLSEAFEAELSKTTESLRKAWYSDQREHWLGWLKEYDGPGYYGRADWDVDAKTVYNRVGNPAMVLWLGEAAGVSTKRLKEAAAKALDLRGSFPRQCGAIREVIPWILIEEHLVQKTKSRR
jgi:hypothetical protein